MVKITDTKICNLESTIYKTTSEQQKRIKEGRAQIADGKFFTNDQVEKEIDEWLNEK